MELSNPAQVLPLDDEQPGPAESGYYRQDQEHGDESCPPQHTPGRQNAAPCPVPMSQRPDGPDETPGRARPQAEYEHVEHGIEATQGGPGLDRFAEHGVHHVAGDPVGGGRVAGTGISWPAPPSVATAIPRSGSGVIIALESGESPGCRTAVSRRGPPTKRPALTDVDRLLLKILATPDR